MKPLLAALAGFALIGSIGVAQLDAQSHRSTRTNSGESFRKPVATPKKATGHFITVEKRVWVPGHYITEYKDVWVPGHYVVTRERRVDAHGCVFYVSVKKYIPGCHERRAVKTYVPGCYRIVTERVWVEHDHGHGHGKHAGHAGHKGTPPGHAKKGKSRGNGHKGSGRGRGRGR